MSEYSIQHKNPDLHNEIKEDFNNILKSNNIWIDHPLSFKDRIGWIEFSDLINKSIKLCKDTLDDLISEFNPSSIVFVGMGGSIQTGKVLDQISTENKYQLFFIDSTNPKDIDLVRKRIDLFSTLFIFMSKSGATLETNKVMSFFIEELSSKGEPNFGNRFIALTDKNTPLEKFANKNNFLKVINAPPNIGGRFSSSTSYGVLPATFMNNMLDSHKNNYKWDLDQIIEKCLTVTSILKNSYDNHDGFLLLRIPEEINQMGTWLEQLIAESTGKNGKGIIPIINNKNKLKCPKIFINNNTETKIKNSNDLDLVINLDKNTIFEDMFIWQLSISLLCKHMSVFPFDEPDVKKSKINTENILKKHNDLQKLEIPYSSNVINNMIIENKTNKALYINLYLSENEKINNSLNILKQRLNLTYNINVVSGFGPRYLHSVGQLQKGGSKNVWSIFFYDEILTNSFYKKYNFKDLCNTFKAQMLGDFNALKELEINTYLVKIDSSKPNPFNEIMDATKE